MFNNIIYLIIVLMVFNMGPPEARVEDGAGWALFMHAMAWVAFALYCRSAFRSFLRTAREWEGGRPAAKYQGLVMRLSVMAVFLFTLDVYLFHLRYWLYLLPGARAFSVVPGLGAVALFFFYLATVWYFAYPAYALVYGGQVGRKRFISGNLRLNVPILFPWAGLTLAYDLILFVPWGLPRRLLDSTGGNMIFFALFLLVLMTFMPRLVQYWWGCRPLPRTEKVRELESFLRGLGFRYRALLGWPLFEGRMLTAGIMGVVPRYRYIMVTEGLMELLPTEELKAVLAHEVGHAKYRHLLFYVLFLLGYMVLSFGLFDLLLYALASAPFFAQTLGGGGSGAAEAASLALSVPILLTMLIYFRFVMGFFMRNFERQADLFAAVTMGNPGPVISSLERIAIAGGRIRDLPSWHHFSIRQRVECLERVFRDPGVVRRHNRFVASAVVTFLAAVAGLGWLLNFSQFKQDAAYRLMSRALEEKAREEPGDARLHRNLAMVHHHLGEHEEALLAYDKALELDPSDPTVLNNLAWLLLTAPDTHLRDPARAMDLAERAVALERNAPFLDTLAEAYYANGLYKRALEVIEDAIAMAEDRRGYYLEQREKFRQELR